MLPVLIAGDPMWTPHTAARARVSVTLPLMPGPL